MVSQEEKSETRQLKNSVISILLIKTLAQACN